MLNKVSLALQSIFIKGCAAFKFFYAAIFLPPDKLAIYSIFVVATTVLDTTTQSGFQNYFITIKREIRTKDINLLRTFNLVKALILVLICLGIGYYAESKNLYYNSEKISNLTIFCGIWFLAKTIHSPADLIFIRKRDFAKLNKKELSYAFIDFTLVLIFINYWADYKVLIISSIISEAARSWYSYHAFNDHLKFDFRLGLLKKAANYGKWIWASNVIITLINQLDKIFLSYIITPDLYGKYQLASKTTQSTITDPFAIASQYLLSWYSEKKRENKISQALRKSVLIGIPIILITSIASYFLIMYLIENYLSVKWRAASQLILYATIPATVGATIAIVIPYVNASGQPRIIFGGILIQSVVLLCFYAAFKNYLSAELAFIFSAAAGLSFLGFITVKIIYDKQREHSITNHISN